MFHPLREEIFVEFPRHELGWELTECVEDRTEELGIVLGVEKWLP
jgi:hypothetical protein